MILYVQFAHPGEKARRRDPKIHTYDGIACPDMKKVCLTQRLCRHCKHKKTCLKLLEAEAITHVGQKPLMLLAKSVFVATDELHVYTPCRNCGGFTHCKIIGRLWHCI